ncbi:brain-derived neurotrophic factor-like [Tiliqua scincoides]|uniref:brain-derived neurotrophic factor-like n=1 Tax=Tiliqua scincoides TaxID=71010 RepID=UPI003462AD43
MLILVYAVATPLLCIIHAAPLPNTTAPLNTSEVICIETLHGEWEQTSPYVTFSREEPTTQPSVVSAQSQYATCDSDTLWVTDKRSAIDIRGRQVTVLSEVQTHGGTFRQYFYETRCRPASHKARGCRGVDRRYWDSKCETKQTYVKALTVDSDVVGWHFIRIDASCVCTLIRRTDPI